MDDSRSLDLGAPRLLSLRSTPSPDIAGRDALEKVLDKAEGMHDTLDKQAKLLTGSGADTMAAVRAACDAIELSVADGCWPLPKYREMLFPV